MNKRWFAIAKATGLTQDLDRDEEVLLVAISLNPEKDGEEIREEITTEKIPFSVQDYSRSLDTLLQKGYVELAEESDEYNWRLTELGRLALMKFSTLLKFDVIYARETNADEEVLNELLSDKEMFEKAHRAAKVRSKRRSREEEEVWGGGPQ